MKKDERLLQLKIILKGIKPAIWRRFLIEESASFEQLHNIIQKVMGWENCHLYEFVIGDVSIVIPDEGYNPAEGSPRTLLESPECMRVLEKRAQNGKGINIDKINRILKNAEKNKPQKKRAVNMLINTLVNSEGQKFKYLYDLGDSWEHEIIIERILKRKAAERYPMCLEGKRNCPPEDCGGGYGYYNLMKIRKNKHHPQYQEKIVGWLGEDYDPEVFVADWVNARLQGKKPKGVWMKK